MLRGPVAPIADEEGCAALQKYCARLAAGKGELVAPPSPKQGRRCESAVRPFWIQSSSSHGLHRHKGRATGL